MKELNKTNLILVAIIIALCHCSITNVYGQMYVHQIYKEAQSKMKQYDYSKSLENAPKIQLYDFFAKNVSASLNHNKDGSYSYIVTLKGTGGHGGFYFPELTEKFKYVEIKVDKNKISLYKQESMFVPSDAYTADDTKDPMKIGSMKVPEDPFQTGGTYDMYSLITMRYERRISQEEFDNTVAKKIHKPGKSSYIKKVNINGKTYDITVRRNCAHNRVPLYRGTYNPNYNAGVAVTKSPSGRVTQTVDRFPDHWFKHKETLTISLDELAQKTNMSKQEVIIYLIANDVLDMPYRNAFIVCAYKAFGLNSYMDQHRINDSIARDQIWNEQIANKKDYRRVADCADNKVSGKEYLYTREFVNRILQRSQELKNDSIEHLFRLAQSSFNNQQFLDASKMAHQILKIDNANPKALQMCYLSDFEQIKKDEKNGRIREGDYEAYLRKYPSSPYVQEVVNHRDRTVFALKNRSIVDLGVGGELALGSHCFSVSAEIEARLGSKARLINLDVGAKYNLFISDFEDPSQSYNSSSFEKSYISVPAMLRVNCIRKRYYIAYLGIGPEFNVKTTSASYEWNKEKIEDLNFSNNVFAVSPCVKMGLMSEKWNFELFALYDDWAPFDKNYIDSYFNSPDCEILLDPRLYEQLFDDGFMNKFRIGISVIYLIKIR